MGRPLLRAGDTRRILPFRVAAPSRLGTFLRSFTFGHFRQLDRVIAETLERVWALGAGPGDGRLVVDIDSAQALLCSLLTLHVRAAYARGMNGGQGSLRWNGTGS